MSSKELLESIHKEDKAKVKQLLDQGCNPDHIHRPSNEKKSLLTHLPIFQASIKGNPTIIKMLIHAGASVNSIGTMLHDAIFSSKIFCLIKSKAFE